MTVLKLNSNSHYVNIPIADIITVFPKLNAFGKLWLASWVCDPYGDRPAKLQKVLSDSAFHKAKGEIQKEFKLFLYTTKKMEGNGLKTECWTVRNLHGSKVYDAKLRSSNEESSSINEESTRKNEEYINLRYSNEESIYKSEEGLYITEESVSTNEDCTSPETLALSTFQDASQFHHQSINNGSCHLIDHEACGMSHIIEIEIDEERDTANAFGIGDDVGLTPIPYAPRLNSSLQERATDKENKEGEGIKESCTKSTSTKCEEKALPHGDETTYRQVDSDTRHHENDQLTTAASNADVLSVAYLDELLRHPDRLAQVSRPQLKMWVRDAIGEELNTPLKRLVTTAQPINVIDTLRELITYDPNKPIRNKGALFHTKLKALEQCDNKTSSRVVTKKQSNNEYKSNSLTQPLIENKQDESISNQDVESLEVKPIESIETEQERLIKIYKTDLAILKTINDDNRYPNLYTENTPNKRLSIIEKIKQLCEANNVNSHAELDRMQKGYYHLETLELFYKALERHANNKLLPNERKIAINDMQYIYKNMLNELIKKLEVVSNSRK